jgi:hypothetical protein
MAVGDGCRGWQQLSNVPTEPVVRVLRDSPDGILAIFRRLFEILSRISSVIWIVAFLGYFVL